MSDRHGRPTIAEVSLDALRGNLRRARELAGPRVDVMAVVKADAYGHGAVAAARAFLDGGAAMLGVSTVAEAIELRRAGIDAPMVVLGGAFRGEEEAVVAHELATAVWSLEQAQALAAAARAAGRTTALHVKVDTGMTRLGLDGGDVIGFAEAVQTLGGVTIAGLFSHFASADTVDTASARAQLARFEDAVQALAASGIRPPHVHLANSAAVISAPAAHFSMVRPGIMLYGYAPAAHLAGRAAVVPALRLRTRIAQTRRVAAETAVGYGGTWVSSRPSTIATLPIGYADGLHRLNSNRARVVVRGRPAPVAGRVCMDHTMIDVTDVPGVAAGDAVVLIGSQDGATVTADDLAGWSETIAYEVLTSIGKRVPRVYVERFDG